MQVQYAIVGLNSEKEVYHMQSSTVVLWPSVSPHICV